MNQKQQAAQAAMSFVRDGMTIGLGTGSTADYFLQALATAIKEGRFRNLRGVPTSIQSARRAMELGIPLVDQDQFPYPDLTVDGADEIDPKLDLIKGLGGALLRERIIAQNSKRLIIIADAGKRVDRLGTRSPLPVEVIPFYRQSHEAFFHELGADPVLRRTADGQIFVTDNGNHIYDCRFEGIEDAVRLERKLLNRAGIVGTGLFVDLAWAAMIAGENGVEQVYRTI